MRRPRSAAVSVVAAVTVSLAACGSAPDGRTSSPARTGAITVFAAASLTEAFTTLGRRFEEANPGAAITFVFGSSSSLAVQITEGAPADVFASASASTMDAVVESDVAETPTTFAQNVLEIAVPPDNPANVTGLVDLEDPAVTVALCQPDVPCGALAATVLRAAGVAVEPITLEADVKAVLTKVRLGEVDAGLVYATDVLAAGDEVTGIDVPADVNASTRYPIATISGSRSPGLAQAFVDYVLSADGAAALTAAGFRVP